MVPEATRGDAERCPANEVSYAFMNAGE